MFGPLEIYHCMEELILWKLQQFLKSVLSAVYFNTLRIYIPGKWDSLQLYVERRKPENKKSKSVKNYLGETPLFGYQQPIILSVQCRWKFFLFRCNYDVNPLCLKGPPTYILS